MGMMVLGHLHIYGTCRAHVTGLVCPKYSAVYAIKPLFTENLLLMTHSLSHELNN